MSLRDDARFDNFWVAQDNRLAVEALKQWSTGAGEPLLTVWGAEGSGITHLLQASCLCGSADRTTAQYLPLLDFKAYPPEEVLAGLEDLDGVCVDDVDCIVGQQAWEQGLFHFYNRMKESGKPLVLAFHGNPNGMRWQLPDLKSRVMGSVVYHVTAPDDEALLQCLLFRAAGRGMVLGEGVAQFILNRANRDTHSLFRILDTLDEASLQQQRKLTVPFVKSVFGW